MPDPAADRNLLFGILALQMDFVTRDALVAAMNAWVLDKAKPLGQILREQGKLAEDEHALLEGLVRKHLEKHGNDPERSLAALSSVGSARRDLLQVAGPNVQASLAHVSATRPDDDPFATRATTAGTPTSSGLRYSILRPHAKGGLGEVFVARDEELRREVALKEIQDRPGALPAGGGGHRRPGASRYCPRLRPGHLRGRPAVLRHALHPRRQPPGRHPPLPPRRQRREP